MTIPNLITSLRIISVPIFVIFLINDKTLWALAIFVLAGVSDGVDGFVARIFDQKSQLGSYLDPLADKILLVAAFVVLSARHFIPPWVTVIVISRDVLILLGVLFLFMSRKEMRTIRPSVVSKITTLMQLVTVFLALSKGHVPIFSQLIDYALYATGILTVTSGLHYMRCWFRMIGEGGVSD